MLILFLLVTVVPLATPAQADFIQLPSFALATSNNLAGGN